jgi:phosphoenolpyruvate carboxylase
MRAEYEATCELVLSITGRDHLADRGWLRNHLKRRNPYVDPLNLLQVQLLDNDDRTELENHVLRLTAKGIAAGMQNTG